MIAFVRGVMRLSICAGSMLYVSGKMSAKTGTAPTRLIAPAVAKNVYGVVTTSSPGPIPSAIKEIIRASLPEETPTACSQPQYGANNSSH